jgi:hypothetical protein
MNRASPQIVNTFGRSAHSCAVSLASLGNVRRPPAQGIAPPTSAESLLGIVEPHGRVLLNAKGLWRDEANTVNLAQSGSFLDMLDRMAFDSSGLLWLSAVRLWGTLGLRGDLALRTLGALVGIGILGALIWSARRFGLRTPILAVGFFCVGPHTVPCGDSLRSYGCGALFVLLTAGFVVDLSKRYTPGKLIAATLASIAAVHSAFPNAALVVALYGAGGLIAFRDFRLRELKALAVAAVGTGASLAIYYPTAVRVSRWIAIVRHEVTWGEIGGGLEKTMGLSQPWSSTAAILVLVAAFAVAVAALLSTRRTGPQRQRVLFVLAAAVLALVGQLAYFRLLSYAPYPWHFLPFVGLACLLGDVALAMWQTSTVWRILRLAGIVAYAIAVAPSALRAAEMRRTNMDTIAAALNKVVHKDDLVVVHPFYYGVSFSRYYAGQAPWTTFPPIADHSLHRWDLIKDKMQEIAPEQPVIDRVESTLRNGRRVWIVGYLILPSPWQARATARRLAPQENGRWDEFAYDRAGAAVLGQVPWENGARVRHWKIDHTVSVNEYENIRAVVADIVADNSPRPGAQGSHPDPLYPGPWRAYPSTQRPLR